MKRALKSLLGKLKAIENEHNGLGDTDVREHMGDHLLRAFFRPEPGFVHNGEYGLEPEANRKVAAALTAFCKDAEAEARRLGLTTFEQRVTAFQDPAIVASSGGDYNDYFGVIELEQVGTPGRVAGGKAIKPVRRAYEFDRPGSLEALRAALIQQGCWSWQAAGEGAEDPYIEVRPEAGAQLRIREGLEKIDVDGSVCPPEHGFMAFLEANPDRIDNIDAAFCQVLGQAGAMNVAEKSAYWW